MKIRVICVVLLALLTQQSFSQTRELATQGWEIQRESMSFDRQTVYVSAKAPGINQYDIYSMHREREGWSKPVLLSESINHPVDDDLWPSISSDEHELFFTRKHIDGEGRKAVTRYDIYVSKRIDGNWQPAQPMLISDGGSIVPMILSDGVSLIYASSEVKPDPKHPHYNLYLTRKVGKYNWTLPELMQEDVNESSIHLTEALIAQAKPNPIITLTGIVSDARTKRQMAAHIRISDAVTQSVLAEHQTSAMGTYTIALPYGKAYSIDIFADGYTHSYLDYDCRELSESKKEKVDVSLTQVLSVRMFLFDAETNMALSQRDYSLSIDSLYKIEFSHRGYETQTLDIDTRNAVLLPSSELDILLRPGKAPLTIRLFDSETHQLLNGGVQLVNRNREEQLSYDGKPLLIRQGDTYEVMVNTVGYIYVDTMLTVPLASDALTMDINLVEIRTDMVLQLRNIQFEYASSDLTEESFAELDQVVRLLKDNPALRIELSAHTDDQGSDTFNKKLSEKRGEAAKRYLVRHGVASDRVTARGYGKTRPLVPNDSDENRAKNRRVEFKVTEI